MLHLRAFKYGQSAQHQRLVKSTCGLLAVCCMLIHTPLIPRLSCVFPPEPHMLSLHDSTLQLLTFCFGSVGPVACITFLHNSFSPGPRTVTPFICLRPHRSHHQQHTQQVHHLVLFVSADLPDAVCAFPDPAFPGKKPVTHGQFCSFWLDERQAQPNGHHRRHAGHALNDGHSRAGETTLGTS